MYTCTSPVVLGVRGLNIMDVLEYRNKHVIKEFISSDNLLSQIGFLTESLITPEKFLKEIDSLLWSFLWTSKQPLVSRNAMYLDKEMGGVNMPNLRNILISKQINIVYKYELCQKASGRLAL